MTASSRARRRARRAARTARRNAGRARSARARCRSTSAASEVDAVHTASRGRPTSGDPASAVGARRCSSPSARPTSACERRRSTGAAMLGHEVARAARRLEDEHAAGRVVGGDAGQPARHGGPGEPVERRRLVGHARVAGGGGELDHVAALPFGGHQEDAVEPRGVDDLQPPVDHGARADEPPLEQVLRDVGDVEHGRRLSTARGAAQRAVSGLQAPCSRVSAARKGAEGGGADGDGTCPPRPTRGAPP